jgi:tRNA(fMet)-specific endonuclease VapC
MILLDSDHITIYRYLDHPRAQALFDKLRASGDPEVATTIVSVEEQMCGWLAEIHRQKDVHKQLPAYMDLAYLFEFYAEWKVVPFDTRAADEFKRLQKQKVRIGTQDLKIASIALVNNALC